MRDKFNQFMQGRYGNDDLNRFLMKIILAAFVLSLFKYNGIIRKPMQNSNELVVKKL